MPEPSVPYTDLPSTDLTVDVVYEGGPTTGFHHDPIHQIVGTSNRGGFRRRVHRDATVLAVLYANRSRPEWPDTIDAFRGTALYHGDNNRPGRDLHDTTPKGNAFLRDVFREAAGGRQGRERVPPMLLFEKAETRLDVRFRGLLVPGTPAEPASGALGTVERGTPPETFRNYAATFTILDVPVVERRWIREFVTGDFHGPAAPPAWRRWVETNTYVPRSVAKARTSDEQHPDSAGHDLVEEIVAFCADDSSAFERCAAALWRMTAPATHDLVPPAGEPTTTGDWTGRYLLGPVDDPMALEFGLAARCHHADDPVRASDVLRLLVTVRDRRAFGVFVTTSFFEPSIYRQVRESGYPLTLICGKDISLLLRTHGYTTREKVHTWLIQTLGT